jgi:hypothetical protein
MYSCDLRSRDEGLWFLVYGLWFMVQGRVVAGFWFMNMRTTIQDYQRVTCKSVMIFPLCTQVAPSLSSAPKSLPCILSHSEIQPLADCISAMPWDLSVEL